MFVLIYHNYDDVSFHGIYSSKEKAEAAIAELSQPDEDGDMMNAKYFAYYDAETDEPCTIYI